MNINTKLAAALLIIAVVIVAIPSFMYEECRIDVPNKHMAILTHKIGKDLERGRHPGAHRRNTRACRRRC